MPWYNPWSWKRSDTKSDQSDQSEPEAKTFEMVIAVGDDGFIQAVNLNAGTLDYLLTVAVWSWVCVTKIAKDVAALPPVIQERDPATGEWTNVPDHELNSLIQRPFGKDKGAPPWTWGQMIEVLSMHLDLAGNAYLLKLTRNGRGRGGPVNGLLAFQLWRPLEVTVNADGNGVAQLYEYSGMQYGAERVVNVMNLSPSSYYDGIATIDAAEDAIRIDREGQRRVRYDLSQRIAPGLIFKVRNLFALDSDQRSEVETYLANNYGAAADQGKPLVIGDQTEISNAPQPQLGDLPEHRKTARDETLATWGVPPPIAGVMDNATLQNAAVALRLYWMQTLRPRIGRILEPINLQAVEPIYGPNTRIWFELADNELGLAVLEGRANVAKILHRDLDYSTNDSAARVGLNMPKHPELDSMNTTSQIAGRIDIGNGSDEDSA